MYENAGQLLAVKFSCIKKMYIISEFNPGSHVYYKITQLGYNGLQS